MVEFQSLWQDVGRYFFLAQHEFLVHLQFVQEKRLPPVSNSEAVPRRAGGRAGDWPGTAKRMYLPGLQYRSALSKGAAAVL